VTGAIVQARMGSTRLPGKVMLPAAGRPLLGYLLERLGHAQTLDRVIVATTTDARDDVIADYCAGVGVPVLRGSENDVLDRYYQAASRFGLSVVVRVTSDCPLIDPLLIDEQVAFFQSHRGELDVVTNRHPLTYPDGQDFDIIAFEALQHAREKARLPEHREHVVPFFWETGMRVHNFEHRDRLFEQHRWTLDYPEDYELIRTIIEALDRPGRLLGTEEILAYLAQHPELPRLNAQYIANAQYVSERTTA
jgi:spore coat polysaccharide biosynthesis protein SpsF